MRTRNSTKNATNAVASRSTLPPFCGKRKWTHPIHNEDISRYPRLRQGREDHTKDPTHTYNTQSFHERDPSQRLGLAPGWDQVEYDTATCGTCTARERDHAGREEKVPRLRSERDKGCDEGVYEDGVSEKVEVEKGRYRSGGLLTRFGGWGCPRTRRIWIVGVLKRRRRTRGEEFAARGDDVGEHKSQEERFDQ